ncbi:MAG: hypothetical protein R3A52_15535 [Polyangiales bacterium]
MTVAQYDIRLSYATGRRAAPFRGRPRGARLHHRGSDAVERDGDPGGLVEDAHAGDQRLLDGVAMLGPSVAHRLHDTMEAGVAIGQDVQHLRGALGLAQRRDCCTRNAMASAVVERLRAAHGPDAQRDEGPP